MALPPLLQYLDNNVNLMRREDAAGIIQKWNPKTDRDSSGSGIFYFSSALDKRITYFLLYYGILHKPKETEKELNRKNLKGFTAFHILVADHHIQSIRLVMKAKIADMNSLTPDGKTALQIAKLAFISSNTIRETGKTAVGRKFIALKFHLDDKMEKWSSGRFSEEEEDPPTYLEEPDFALDIYEGAIPLTNYDLTEMLEASKRIYPAIVNYILELNKEILTQEELMNSQDRILTHFYNSVENQKESIEATKGDLLALEEEEKNLKQIQSTIIDEITQLRILLEPQMRAKTELSEEVAALQKMQLEKVNIQVQRNLLAQEIFGLKSNQERMQLIAKNPSANQLLRQDEEQQQRVRVMQASQEQLEKESAALTEAIGTLTAETKKRQTNLDEKRRAHAQLVSKELEAQANIRSLQKVSNLLESTRNELKEAEACLEKEKSRAAKIKKKEKSLKKENKVKEGLSDNLKQVQEETKRLQNYLEEEKSRLAKLKFMHVGLYQQISDQETLHTLQSLEPLFTKVHLMVARGTLKDLNKILKIVPPTIWQGKSLLTTAFERLRDSPSEEAINIAQDLIARTGHVSLEERALFEHCLKEESLSKMVASPELHSHFYDYLSQKIAHEALEHFTNFRGNIDFKDPSGDPLLHLAIRCKNAKLVQEMLQKGANKELTNSAGKKAIDLPECEGPIKGLLLLEEKPTDHKPRSISLGVRQMKSDPELPPLSSTDASRTRNISEGAANKKISKLKSKGHNRSKSSGPLGEA